MAFGSRRVPLLYKRPAVVAGGAFAIEDLTNIVAAWDIAILTSLYEERTGGGTTQSSVNGVVGTIRDLTGGGNHLVAPSDAARMTLRQSGAIYYLESDATNDGYQVTGLSPGTSVAIGGAFRHPVASADYSTFFGIINASSYSDVGTLVLAQDTDGGKSGWWVDGLYRLERVTVDSTDYVEDVTKVGTAISRLSNSEAELTYTSANNSISGAFVVGAASGGVANNMRFYGAHLATTYETGERTQAREYWAARCGVTL